MAIRRQARNKQDSWKPCGQGFQLLRPVAIRRASYEYSVKQFNRVFVSKSAASPGKSRAVPH
jgi:hypothetical protein